MFAFLEEFTNYSDLIFGVLTIISMLVEVAILVLIHLSRKKRKEDIKMKSKEIIIKAKVPASLADDLTDGDISLLDYFKFLVYHNFLSSDHITVCEGAEVVEKKVFRSESGVEE